ncbi:MAG: hypothetical protein AMXMBFR33_52820 [Candidatus Xenobia bacterium]|jgi:hypothetical protein
MAPLAEDEFYYENGLLVFTERFHLRRGACCGSGCRHCPYQHEKVPPEKRADVAPPRPFFTALLVLLFLALLVPAQADSLLLFVRNRPFEGPVRTVGSELYAPLDDLLRALGCSWERDEAAISIRLGGDGSNPRLVESLPIFFEGRQIDPGAGMVQGRLYVSVSELARAVNADYRLNRQLGTADLYAPTALPGAPSAERPVVKAGEQGSRVQLVRASFALASDSARPDLQALRGFVLIKNEGPAVEGVTVTVEVLDGAGTVVGRYGEKVGRLEAGQTLSVQLPTWLNFNRAEGVKPRVEVLHLRAQ